MRPLPAVILLLSLSLVIALSRAGLASIPDAGPRLLQEQPAAGKFLIASESIRDPRFRESVILLLNHDAQGTLGVIVNRPTRVQLSEVVDEGLPGQLFFGGPVQPSTFSLLVRSPLSGEPGTDKGEDEEGSFILGELYFVFGTDKVLERISRLEADETARVYAGYAGWSPGQLDAELRNGGWYLALASTEAVFAEDPASVWKTLMRRVSGRWI